MGCIIASLVGSGCNFTRQDPLPEPAAEQGPRKFGQLNFGQDASYVIWSMPGVKTKVFFRGQIVGTNLSMRFADAMTLALAECFYKNAEAQALESVDLQIRGHRVLDLRFQNPSVAPADKPCFLKATTGFWPTLPRGSEIVRIQFEKVRQESK